MKKTIYFIGIILCQVLCSCNNEDKKVEFENGLFLINKWDKYPQKIVEIKADTLPPFFTSNKAVRTRAEFISDSIWADGKGHTQTYENNEITVSPSLSSYIYLGDLIDGESFANNRYKPISKPTDPITISVSFPADNVVKTINRPSLSAMRSALREVLLNNNMSGTQSASFEYNMTKFSYYDEVKLAFGSNINVANVLNIGIEASSHKIKSKTGIIAKVIQKYYTVDMDIPADGNLLLNNNDLSGLGNYSPVYINSIAFGRLGIITVESNKEYQDVKLAFKAAFNAAKINGNLNISAENQTILENCDIKIYIIGGDESYKVVEGFDEFKNFILTKGEYSSNNPGLPISFTASYLSDNSPYYTRFKVNISE